MTGGNLERRRKRHLEAASGYLMLDMPDHALKELQAIGGADAGCFEVYALKGEALRQQRDYEGALQAYLRALNISPDHIEVLFGMAWCYKRLGRLDCAIAAMERAYAAHPRNPVVLYNLSCYWALAGEKEQALSWLGRALRMDSSLRRLIPEESDFNALRNDPDFRFIVQDQELFRPSADSG